MYRLKLILGAVTKHIESLYHPEEDPLASSTYSRLFKAHRKLARSLRKYKLSSLTSFIAGLFTMPEFQASAVRLELLQHLAVANARGELTPLTCSLTSWLETLGEGWAGQMEDPAEDVFVSRVSTSNRDFLIFQGLYESSAFYLQCFINVLDNMPSQEPFAGLRRAAYALLTLSDETIKRSGIPAFAVGDTKPIRSVAKSLVRRGGIAKERVVFRENDLARLGIAREDIETFILDRQDRDRLRRESYGHSSLERRPLLAIGGDLYLTLPAAVSMAVRRMVIEFCLSNGYEEQLYRVYVNEFAETFRNVPLLGGDLAPPLPFQKLGGVFFANAADWVDEGRLLHICFVVDSFVHYDLTGVVGLNPDPSRFSRAIKTSIAQIQQAYSSKPRFRAGLSLIVLCPWGRPMMCEFESVEDRRWRVESVSAPDLISMSWASSFSPLNLWSLLDMQARLAQIGVRLMNVNGLLNLYAWSESLEGHLIPHGQLPDDLAGKPSMIVVKPNSLLEVRKKGAKSSDIHRARTWDKRTVRVRRLDESSFFEEDENAPLYVSLDDLDQQRLVAVCETNSRGWWITVEIPNSTDRDLHFPLWHALATWLERSARVIEEKIRSLPEGPIAWICRFEDRDPTDQAIPIPLRAQAKALLEINVDDHVVRVTAHDGFLASFRVPENMAESLLVEAFVSGTCRLSSEDHSPEIFNSLVQQIVPDQWARDMHLFSAREFRNFVARKARGKPIVISKIDDALSRIGLGWRSRKLDEGPRIEGIEPCCQYLNSLVDSIWTELQSKLKEYNREHLLFALLRNHEAVEIEAGRWLRTARAALSLHHDKEAAEREASKEIARLNAASLSTRILVEMALCECPKDAGIHPGRLDISRLLAEVMQMHSFGGWSEAIRYQSKAPEIRITPFGDVHTDVDFDETIVTPYGQTLGVIRYRHGANTYEQHFRDVELVGAARGEPDPEFCEAWTEAFCFTIDDVHIFMDNLEDEGIKRQELVFSTTETEIFALDGSKPLDEVVVRKILKAFSLSPRSTWASTPNGFRPKDWYPWRFRRRLALISRPIVRLDDPSPRYLVAPGLVRAGIRKVLDYCYTGGYEAKDFPPGRMRSWIGAAENRRGQEFNKEVAAHLEKLGWKTRLEIKLTEILNRKLDQDYGDVDVLAWKAGRVLAIECKDLELAMTMAEIARQLHDFRGELNVHGKPDRMKKHLVRLKLLNEHRAAVACFVGEQASPSLEGLFVFSEVVPMYFAGVAANCGVRVLTKEELSSLCN